MKQKSIIYILLFSFVCGISFSSCEDMLDVQSDRHSYNTAQDTLYAYWGVLKTLQNVGERYILLGELRGDLVMENYYDGEISDSLRAIANFSSTEDGDCRYLAARDFYAIINNCNAYIAAADTNRVVYGGTSTNSKYMLREYAQVEAIRAWTYLQLVKIYKEVPFYLEPLTSTDAINGFINNPNHETVNAQSLPEKIGGRLIPLIGKEDRTELVYPEYGNYELMAHSSFCYFPLHLVMGDIYLEANRYEEAAKEYYTWMQNDKYSSVPGITRNCASPSKRFSSGGATIGYDVKDYNCFDVYGHERREDDETITVIPGTTNKLWGNVLRGANEAFGWTAEVRVQNSGSADTAKVTSSVTLTPKTVKRQFIASNEFARLTRSYPCLYFTDGKQTKLPDEVPYDYYTTTGTDPDTARDCRYGWYYKTFAEAAGGEFASDSAFISKQNPSGSFSTTYPVVYRRALVWLRFAEAINRAGYPEYAYSILRDGMFIGVIPTLNQAAVDLFNDETIRCIRTVEEEEIPGGEGEEPTIIQTVYLSLLGKDVDTTTVPLLPNQTITEFTYSHQLAVAEYDELLTTDAEKIIDLDSISASVEDIRSYLTTTAPTLINTLTSGTESYTVTCGNYIPVNRMLAASKTPWGDFLINPGSHTNFDVASSLSPTKSNVRRLGIHQRGSNYASYSCNDDPFYYFDKCVKDKWSGYNGPLNYYTAPAADYAEYEKNLIQAVEELIIDELALECCFEGNRYFDLVRFSSRRPDPLGWLNEKINKRGGTPVTITAGNMYLKLPTK